MADATDQTKAEQVSDEEQDADRPLEEGELEDVQGGHQYSQQLDNMGQHNRKHGGHPSGAPHPNA